MMMSGTHSPSNGGRPVIISNRIAERVLVRVRVHAARGAELLGCHVLRRPERLGRAGEAGRPLAHHLDEPEVEDLHDAPTGDLREEDVRGFDVSMHEPRCVRLRDADRRLEDDVDGFHDWQPHPELLLDLEDLSPRGTP